MNSDMPVFIAGPDRSGTSLIFSLLASHPNISMVRRTNMWRYFHQRYGDLSRPDNFERCLLDMTRYNRMRHLHPDRDRLRNEFHRGAPTYGRLFALFYQHHAERTGKQRWGDKSLHTEHYVDRVFSEFPNAKIIHMTRDPRDRYASVRKRHNRDNPRLGGTTGRWLLSMRKGLANQRRYPERYKFIRFEDLAGNPEATLKEICEFIEAEYTPEMLTMSGAPEHNQVGGNSSFEKIEPGKISKKPVGRYREVLTNMEIQFIQMTTGKYMDVFEYQREPFKLTAEEKAGFYAKVIPTNLLRMVAWMLYSTVRINRGERIPRSRILPDSVQEVESHV